MGRRILLLFTMCHLIQLVAAQNYTIYSFTKGVKVESAKKTTEVSKGMTVKPNDILIIPQGGTVSIHDKTSGDIYTSVSTGRLSVTKIKIDARRQSSSKIGTIMSGVNARFSGNGNSGNGRVYVEKGKVNRSLSLFDPEGDDVEMDPSLLAKSIAYHIANKKSDEFPVEISFGDGESNGLFFRIENTLDYPVYFNVLQTKGSANQEIEISPLGQPNGSYVLLPHQALQREHLVALPEESSQLIVLAPCQYDLDKVIDEVNNFLITAYSMEENETPACVLFLK